MLKRSQAPPDDIQSLQRSDEPGSRTAPAQAPGKARCVLAGRPPFRSPGSAGLLTRAHLRGPPCRTSLPREAAPWVGLVAGLVFAARETCCAIALLLNLLGAALAGAVQ
jgi:hypothetical protein